MVEQLYVAQYVPCSNQGILPFISKYIIPKQLNKNVGLYKWIIKQIN
jgi:hypothetical protein